MKTKGLFSVLFSFIMLILIIPNASLINNDYVLTNNKQVLNTLSLNIHPVIADALSDQTYDNSCAMDDLTNYQSKIINYLENYLSTYLESSNIQYSFEIQDISISNSQPNSFDISFNLFLNTENQNSTLYQNLEKKIKISQNVYFNNSTPCNIKVKDNYANNYEYLDLTE